MQADMNLPAKASAEQIIDLRHTFHVLLRAKWRILLFTLFTCTLAVFVLLNMAPVYRATSTMLLEAQQARAIKIEEVYGFNSAQQEYYLTQFELLKSRTIAEQVFDRFNVSQHPEYTPKPGLLDGIKELLFFLPSSDDAVDPEYAAFLARKAQLDKFVSNIEIEPVRRTQLVRLRFSSEDPKLAQDVANALGEAYINNQLDARFGITQKANSWLGGRVGELLARLEESEARLERFKAQNNLVDVAGVTALDQRELENLNEQLGVARAKKAETDAFLNLVRRFGRSDISRLENLSEITSHPSVQAVKREVLISERKVIELSKVFGPRHPRMLAAQAELSTVQESLRQQIIQLIDGVEKEAEASTQRLAALEERFEQVRGRFSGLGTLESDYRRLEREVETNRRLYDSFMSRQKETEVTGDFDAPIARFTDLAQLPTIPEKPKKKLILVLVFVASLGLGMVFALLHDALNDTIKSSHDVEKNLKQRSLGFFPRAPKKLKEADRVRLFFNPEQRAFRESVGNIRTGLSLLAINRPLQVVMVTSSFPGEGKTFSSLNIGFAFGALERVLVIDADMRKPTVAEKLGLPAYQEGLSNILAGNIKFADCVVHDEQGKVDILTAGSIPLNPLELLAGDKLSELIADLRQHYDKIIIDTPPVQAVSDALQIAPLTDAVLLVVKADQTRSTAVHNSIGKINQAHAQLFGVILNQMDMNKMAAYYGNYSNYGNYGYYGATPPAEKT